MTGRSRHVVLVCVATVGAITVIVLNLSLLFHPHIPNVMYRRYVAIAVLTELGALVVGYGLGRFAVAQLGREADEAQAKLRLFLAETGHELRTPLAVIRGALGVFRRSTSTRDPATATLLDGVDDELARLSDTVEKVLLLARLDVVRQPSCRSIDVSFVLAELADEGRVRGADIALDAGSTPATMVTIDETALREAIRNVIDNAIRYAPGSPVRLSVARHGDELTIRVADDGPGMDDDDRTLACERFYRGTAAQGSVGSGLGLAIARATAERFGGRVEIASQPGRGCTVSIIVRPDA